MSTCFVEHLNENIYVVGGTAIKLRIDIPKSKQ